MNELIKLRDRGGKVIVINPVREIGLVKFGSPSFPVTSLVQGSEIASLYLQPIPGSDFWCSTPRWSLMFYPEVNAIFKAKIDRRCGTPGFKRVLAVVYV
jgi:hypothetical protein